MTVLTDYEFIIVSPYDLPPELEGKKNVKLIKDWGCPSRCSQIGLMHSQGEYVVWCADDGLFCSGLAIDKALDIIPKHKKGVAMLLYQEGPRPMRKGYWNIDFHASLRQKYVPKGYTLIMTALIRRDYLVELGGWDCGFEQLGVASPDLAIRLQNDGAEVIVGENFMHLDIIKGKGQGHGPIVEAIFQNDIPYFTDIYSDPISATRTKIDFDNWKQTEEVWSRRFKA
ncbi:MAG: hypothetical protein ACXAC5_00815 [Promethearchaeota archaeon]